MKLFYLCLFITSFTFAAPRYFLCGPDEDGCSPAYYSSCLCMPYDDATAGMPYCLDFNIVACIPLKQKPNCPHGDIFKDQASCVASAFQSMPDPSCPIVSERFCKLHHVSFCAKDGGMDSCRATS